MLFYLSFLSFRKNKHEKLIVPICVESFRKKKEAYYGFAKNIFQEKHLVKWKVSPEHCLPT